MGSRWKNFKGKFWTAIQRLPSNNLDSIPAEKQQTVTLNQEMSTPHITEPHLRHNEKRWNPKEKEMEKILFIHILTSKTREKKLYTVTQPSKQLGEEIESLMVMNYFPNSCFT